MMWLVVIVIVVALAFAVPRFGKMLLIISGVLLVLGLLAAAALYVVKQREDAAREEAKKLINRDDLEFVDMALRGGNVLPGSYRLIGRVRNRSTFHLSELRLKLTLRDCPKGVVPSPRPEHFTDAERNVFRRACEVVGEEQEHVYASVPAHQARDLDQLVSFSGFKDIRGDLVWDYAILETVGRQ